MAATAPRTPTRVQAPASTDSELAATVKALVLAGDRDAARERFADLVARQQRRAVRIAYNYLRDAHDADEAVQDAFLKVFTHITSYREEYPFEVWFTRILVNGCLDLRKARTRRLRWALPMSAQPDAPAPPEPAAQQPSPEDRLMSSERARQITSAVEQLPDRQRLVFTLCHISEHTTSEVSQALGLSEATVRVHLFRAGRRARARTGAVRSMNRAHLSDDRLIEICLADSFSPIDEPHLRKCERCEGRRMELASTLADVSLRVADEADAAFPPERLARQRMRILQQIDHLGRPARVIAFPAGHTSEPARPAARRVRRWVAAAGAVAASFLVGIYTEHFAHQYPMARPETRLAARVADGGTPRSRPAAAAIDDDELLGQIELAASSTGPAVLAPLDALTPRAWEAQ